MQLRFYANVKEPESEYTQSWLDDSHLAGSRVTGHAEDETIVGTIHRNTIILVEIVEIVWYYDPIFLGILCHRHLDQFAERVMLSALWDLEETFPLAQNLHCLDRPKRIDCILLKLERNEEADKALQSQQ